MKAYGIGETPKKPKLSFLTKFDFIRKLAISDTYIWRGLRIILRTGLPLSLFGLAFLDYVVYLVATSKELNLDEKLTILKTPTDLHMEILLYSLVIVANLVVIAIRRKEKIQKKLLKEFIS